MLMIWVMQGRRVPDLVFPLSTEEIFSLGFCVGMLFGGVMVGLAAGAPPRRPDLVLISVPAEDVAALLAAA